MKYLLLILIIAGKLHAQPGKQATSNVEAMEMYRKVCALYANSPGMDLRFKMLYYYDKEKTASEIIDNCRAIRSAESAYSRYGKVELLYQKPYSINVDNEQKIIYLDQYLDMRQLIQIPEPKALEELNAKFLLVNIQGNLNRILILPKDGELKSVSVDFDINTLYIKRYEINYETEAEFGVNIKKHFRLEIQFTEQKFFNSPRQFPEFNYSRFIKKGTNNKVELTPLLSGYQFYNMLQ